MQNRTQDKSSTPEASLQSLKSQIGHYDPPFVRDPSKSDEVNEAAKAEFEKKLQAKKDLLQSQNTDPVKEKLYKGINNPEAAKNQKSAREQFIDALQEVLNDPIRNNTDPTGNPTDRAVKLEDLLGPRILTLYHNAIAEEEQDPNFRDAVLAESLRQYDGPKWSERVVLWVGGPSASGKSFGADSAIREMSSKLPKSQKTEDDGKTNVVAFVDGGIEREVSQMRQLVLQVALAKGYPGINDLHKHSKLGIKKHIEKAALASGNISLVIPNTFSNPKTMLKIKKFAKLKNTRQVYSQVVAPKEQGERFRSSVERMGISRAYKSKFGEPKITENSVVMNNRNIGCESKKYQKKYFETGRVWSERAKNYYMKASGQDKMYLEITNDLAFVRYDDKKQQWQLCEKNYTGPSEKLSYRAFEKWKQIEPSVLIKVTQLSEAQHNPNFIKEEMTRRFIEFSEKNRFPSLIQVYGNDRAVTEKVVKAETIAAQNQTPAQSQPTTAPIVTHSKPLPNTPIEEAKIHLEKLKQEFVAAKAFYAISPNIPQDVDLQNRRNSFGKGLTMVDQHIQRFEQQLKEGKLSEIDLKHMKESMDRTDHLLNSSAQLLAKHHNPIKVATKEKVTAEVSTSLNHKPGLS